MFLYFIIYWIALLRLKWLYRSKKYLSRFDHYDPYDVSTNLSHTGFLPSKNDWLLGTPSESRKENLTIIASNSFNKNSLILELKWRPQTNEQTQNIISILTKLSVEIEGTAYDYQNVDSYHVMKPQDDKYNTQYGSIGSNLKLKIIQPNRKYRLLFRGYMNKRDSPEQKRFVKLNLLLFATSKVYDFQERFDSRKVAEEVALKRPKNGLYGALRDVIFHDKHEHLLRAAGEYHLGTTKESDDSKHGKLYLWGFHSKFFVDDQSNKLRCKRILGFFRNGRAFHLGVCENVSNNFDPNERFTIGYQCFSLNPSVGPINQDKNSTEFWNKLSSDSLEVPSFIVEAQEHKFRIASSRRRSSSSSFLDFKLETKYQTAGWGYIQVNDNLDTPEEVHLVEMSRRALVQALNDKAIMDPKWLQSLQSPSKRLVVSLDDTDCLYTNLVGSKGASLARIKSYLSTKKQSKFSVPDALVLTRFVYDELKESNRNLVEQIRQFEASIGRGQLDHLKADCERLQQVICNDVKISSSTVDSIKDQLIHLFGIRDFGNLDGRHFAVRSSSWGEDEDNMSSAGQLETVLKVGGNFDDLAKAILLCYSSKFSLKNIEYKRQYGLPLDLPMAIIVQVMIDCEKAGNMTSCKPINGDEGEMLIVSVLGLGEQVVSGLESDVESVQVKIVSNQMEKYELERHVPETTSLEQSDDFRQKLKFEFEYSRGLSHLENQEPNVAKNLEERICSEEEVRMLAICGLNLAHFFRCPQEIEWGYHAGQWHLFQSRPVTGLENLTKFELLHEADIPSRAECDFVTRANLCEVMPCAITPLQASFNLVGWNIYMSRFFSKIPSKEAWQQTPAYMSMDIMVDSHYVFFCLRGGGLFRLSEETNSASRRAMEIGLFGHEVQNDQLVEAGTEMAEKKPSVNLFEMGTLLFLVSPTTVIEQVKAKLDQLKRDISGFRLRSSTKPGQRRWSPLEGLFNQTKEAFAGSYSLLRLLVFCNGGSGFSNYALLNVLSKYITDPVELYSTLCRLLAGSSNVISAEIPRRIERMAKLVARRGQPEVRAFVSMLPMEALKYVSRNLKDELAIEFDAFMSDFGHRCYNEYSISELSWRQTPETVVEMLQSNVRRYLEVDGIGTSQASAPGGVRTGEPEVGSLDKVLSELTARGNPVSLWDRLWLKYWHVPRTQQFINHRERAKDLMIRHSDIMRDVIRQLALEMCQMNLLPSQDLIFYLFLHEIEAFFEGPQPALVFLANQRRMEAQINNRQNNWRFDEIESGHELIPHHLRSIHLAPEVTGAQKLKGTPASAGQARGRVRIIENFDELDKVQPGEILVIYAIDIAYTTVFPLLSGIISQVGGLISHGLVVVREFGLPALIGIPDVTRILKNGEQILLDADRGLIVRLDHLVEE